MHAFVRKGLLLSAATGTLVMGYAGTAAADSGAAVAQGAASGSPGAVSGNVAQVPADVPVQVCGDAVAGGAALVGSSGNTCLADGTMAGAAGSAVGSPGAVSGNVAQVPADVPVQACGLAGAVLSADVGAHDNDCGNGGTAPSAVGAAADSPGLASGNVLQAPVDVPVQACGDSVAVLGFGVGATDNHCVNGGPGTTAPAQGSIPSPAVPPVAIPSPAVPPVAVPCPTASGQNVTPLASGIPAPLAQLLAPAMPALPMF